MKLKLAILLLAICGVAEAEITGNDLYAQLTSSSVSENLQGFAYLAGVLDTEYWYFIAELTESFPPSKEKFRVPHICFDRDKITFSQIIDVVLKYLTAHPERRHKSAQPLIRFALLESFPCADNPEGYAQTP